MPTLVYVLPTDWAGLPQRFHGLARALVPLGWTVRVLCPRPWRASWAEGGLGACLRPWTELEEAPGLEVRRVPTLPGYRRRSWGVRVQWAWGWRAMARAAATWGPSEVLMLADPALAPLAEALPHRLLVYEAVDRWPAFWPGGPGQALARQEAKLARQANLVVVSSPALAAALAGAEAWCLPNGLDLAHWQRQDAAAAPWPPHDGPQVAFMGHVGPWVDLPMVAALARRLPHWRFVFVGPWEVPWPGTAPPNLLRLPTIPPSARLAHLMACPLWWVPFGADPIAQAADPLKAYEALAAGRRLLAPPLPALAELPPGCLRLQGGVEGWARALEAGWAEGLPSVEERGGCQGLLDRRDWAQLAGRLDLRLRGALAAQGC